LNFSENYENAPGGACDHAWLLLEAVKFPARFLAKKWLILVDLRERILMTVVSTAFDG
jgi:hypothetical protein